MMTSMPVLAYVSIWLLVPEIHALRMATYYANAVLYDSHGIAIDISGYGLKLALIA
jgi:hypothetical protein